MPRGTSPRHHRKEHDMATETAKKMTPAQREAAREARTAKVEQMQADLTAAVEALTESG
ncbi:hypothetical protein GS921_23985, partial [Rhodococcus hoagii]|nr:hypothetical protein [Prescottella equi]